MKHGKLERAVRQSGSQARSKRWCHTLAWHDHTSSASTVLYSTVRYGTVVSTLKFHGMHKVSYYKVKCIRFCRVSACASWAWESHQHHRACANGFGALDEGISHQSYCTVALSDADAGAGAPAHLPAASGSALCAPLKGAWEKHGSLLQQRRCLARVCCDVIKFSPVRCLHAARERYAGAVLLPSEHEHVLVTAPSQSTYSVTTACSDGCA